MQDIMWSILLITFLALKGGVCNLADNDNDFSFLREVSNSAMCDNVGQAQEYCMSELKGENVMPVSSTEESLDESCPSLLKYADCVEDTLKMCSHLDHSVIIAKSQVGVLRDLCDEDSDLRKSYLRIAPCYMGLRHYYPYDENCFRSGVTLYEAYLNSSLIQVHIDGYDKKSCFSAAYATACIIATIDRVCGADASAVLIEILTRAKSLEERCPTSYIQELKAEFFPFLKTRYEENEWPLTEVDNILIINDPRSPGMEKAIKIL